MAKNKRLFNNLNKINHLIRGGILALLVVITFTVIRAMVIPDSFGKYGHYREEAIAEEIAREPVFIEPEVCKECHAGIYQKWTSGGHKDVTCENCHSLGKNHLAKPTVKSKTKTIAVYSSNTFCLKCHYQLPNRPAGFESVIHHQIEPTKHLKGKDVSQCVKCHNPHYPMVKIADEKTIAVGEEKTQPSSSDKIQAMGQKIYEDKCLSCHGKTGDGKTRAAELYGYKMTDLSSPVSGQGTDGLVNIIRSGQGDMPGYEDKLSKEQIRELVRYVEGFRK